jgi:serine/threonine protein kinase
VWEALDGDGQSVAIKVLKRSSREARNRFLREIGVQRTLTEEGFVGILPVLGSSETGRDQTSEALWLAMPLAIPMNQALGDSASATSVIEAVHEIAQHLELLAARGIAHRDLKPANLFFYNGHWVIGDFGLVDLPNSEPLTEAGRVLGPRFYLAPEMLSDGGDPDGTVADVYSLAKVLWVLLTGQTYPPPGPHRIDESGMSLTTWVEHDRASELDLLIERATTYSPEERISMSDFRRELDAILAPPQLSPHPTLDRQALARRIDDRMLPGVRASQAFSASMAAVDAALTELSRGASGACEELKALLPNAFFHAAGNPLALKWLPSVRAVHRQTGWYGSLTAPTTPSIVAQLMVGVRSQVIGTATLVAATVVIDNGNVADPEIIVWKRIFEDVPIGSAQQANAVAEIEHGFRSSIDRVLQEFERLSSTRRDDTRPMQSNG